MKQHLSQSPAPVVQPPRPVDVEGAVAAAEVVEVLRVLGEPARDPELAERPQQREVLRPAAERLGDDAPEARPRTRSLLEYWWLIARPSTTSVADEADHSFDMTTASRPSSTAATSAIAEMIPVTGTCPLRKPSSRERSTCSSMSRSARTIGSPVTAAGSSIAANRSPGRLTTNSAGSSTFGRRSSTVTIESMPPPNGISGRPGAGP